MIIVLVVFFYSVLVIFEYRPLYKQKGASDFNVNVILGILSFIIAILLALDIKIPSPARPLKDIIEMVLGK